MKMSDVNEKMAIKQMQPGGNLYFTKRDVQTNPAQVLGKICGVFAIVRPFVKWASTFFLVPAKWKRILNEFITLLDTMCGTAQE